MSWFTQRDKKPGILLQMCYRVLTAGNIPQHVAFIMDGNRRFARKEQMSKKEGHTKGFEKLTEVLQWCYELNIPEVSVYAFSIENFKRSADEVDALMDLLKDKLNKLLEEEEALMKYGVSIRFIGNVSMFRDDIQEAIAKVVHLTKDNHTSFLNIAVAYTSRDEITQAVREVSIGLREGKIKESDITEELLENCFYTSESKPVDLLIRTSGEVRLSDFLVWQTSFSVLCFIEVLWPEMTVWHFFYCILKYQLGFSNMQNAKELSTLKEHRAQMESDVKQAYLELRETGNVDETDVNINNYASERSRRTTKFLLELKERRMSYLQKCLLKS